MKGIIFDLDGVICSTDAYHYRAWKQKFREIGIDLTEQVNNLLRGVSRMAGLDRILELYGAEMSAEEKLTFAEEKNALYVQSLGAMSPADLDPSVKETLDTLRERGFKLAIGSSSKNALYVLERIGLAGYFDAVSDGNGIARSKPDPEVFLRAAKLIGLSPSECLVVEDAVSGVDAAADGGFTSVAMGDAAGYERADFRIERFSELLPIAGFPE